MGHIKHFILLLLFLLLTAPSGLHAKNSKQSAKLPGQSIGLPPAQVIELKHWSNPDYTRVAISLERDVVWQSHELDKGADRNGKPGRIIIDLNNTRQGATLRDITIGDGLLKGVRTALYKPGVVRIVLDTDKIRDYKIFHLSDPARLIIDVRGDRQTEISRLETSLSAMVLDSSDPVVSSADNRADVKRPPRTVKKQPVFAKIRRVVIDPGHGGHDPGAVGLSGLQEKDVVLSIGLKLREKLRQELGLDVVMTRSSDLFIPLEERTAIANKVNADLFVSIHANAAPNRNAAGIETYYLNLAKTEKVAQLAAKENGTSLEKVSTLQAILFDLMANYKLNDSAHLAEEVQRQLYKTLKDTYPETKSLGVKQGPFYVLVGATMPSILVETAFISNSSEEAHMRDPAFHDLAAEGILDGISSYIATLN